MNSEYLLAQLERSLAKLDRTPLRKSMAYTGNTRRRAAPDFGKPGIQPANIDLCKAETALRRLDQAGALTKSQSAEAWRRLMNLRPVEIVRLK